MLTRNQLKICSRPQFVNVIYKHLPVWNRWDVIPYVKINGITFNSNLGSGEVYTLEKLELGQQTKAAAAVYVQTPLTSLHLRTFLLWVSCCSSTKISDEHAVLTAQSAAKTFVCLCLFRVAFVILRKWKQLNFGMKLNSVFQFKSSKTGRWTCCRAHVAGGTKKV